MRWSSPQRACAMRMTPRSFSVFGDRLRLVGRHGQIPFAGPVGQHTLALAPGRIIGRAVLDRRTIQVADILTEANEYPRVIRVRFNSVIALRSPCLWSTQARQLG